jgi:hypothetical protein
MLEKKVYVIPEKVIKIHGVVKQKDSLKDNYHKPLWKGEIFYYASRCLEIKKMQNLLLEQSLTDI